MMIGFPLTFMVVWLAVKVACKLAISIPDIIPIPFYGSVGMRYGTNSEAY